MDVWIFLIASNFPLHILPLSFYPCLIWLEKKKMHANLYIKNFLFRQMLNFRYAFYIALENLMTSSKNNDFIFMGHSILARNHPFSTCAKFFQKVKCTYQGVRIVIFYGKYYVRTKWLIPKVPVCMKKDLQLQEYYIRMYWMEES